MAQDRNNQVSHARKKEAAEGSSPGFTQEAEPGGEDGARDGLLVSRKTQ